MLHIRKVKTFSGLKYAVVDEFTYVTTDSEGKTVKKTEHFPVEYKTGTGFNTRIEPALFPVTEEGLKRAKEIQKLFKNKRK
jgi:hypothetical protein